MAERLAAANTAVALLANTGATVAVLAVLIGMLAPISGAHFNPAVSFIDAFPNAMPWRYASAYALVQVLGCCLGALLAHAMFELPRWQWSLHARTGVAQWLAEAVATCGLLLVVIGHRRREDAAWMVAAWIGAAYWFTASPRSQTPRSRLHAPYLTPSPASGRKTRLALSSRRAWERRAALLLSKILFESPEPRPSSAPDSELAERGSSARRI